MVSFQSGRDCSFRPLPWTRMLAGRCRETCSRLKPHQFGDTQPAGETNMQHGAIPSTQTQVAVERFRHRRMQRDKSALAELCPPDQQHTVGLQIVEPQVERFRDPQPRRGRSVRKVSCTLPAGVGMSVAVGRRQRRIRATSSVRRCRGEDEPLKRETRLLGGTSWAASSACRKRARVNDVTQPNAPVARRRGIGRPGYRG